MFRLHTISVENKYTSLITELYTGNNISGKKRGGKFPLKRDVRLGDALSTIISTVELEQFKELQRKWNGNISKRDQIKET